MFSSSFEIVSPCSFNVGRNHKLCKINVKLIFYQKMFISFNMCFETCTFFNVIVNVLIMFMNSINKKYKFVVLGMT